MKIGLSLYKNQKGFSVWVEFPQRVVICKEGKNSSSMIVKKHLLRNKGGERRITLTSYEWTIVYNENRKINIYWADVKFVTTPRPVPILCVNISELMMIYPNAKVVELPNSKDVINIQER